MPKIYILDNADFTKKIIDELVKDYDIIIVPTSDSANLEQIKDYVIKKFSEMEEIENYKNIISKPTETQKKKRPRIQR